MNVGKVTALTVLDLLPAFDTIDHTVHLRRLDDWLGLPVRCSSGLNHIWTVDARGLARWLFVLQSRSQICSPLRVSLGPMLFTLYTTPLNSMISGHSTPHHLCADDNQLYVSFALGDSVAALNCLQSCLASVQWWMSMNKLKLNQIKLNSSVSETNDSGANSSLFFLLSFSVSKLTPQNLLGILG